MEITVERSEDYRLLRDICVHPVLYRASADDFSPDPEQFELKPDWATYILARLDGEPVGFWALVQHTPVLLEVHTMMLPQAWGGVASRAALKLLEWVWANTRCERLITSVPEDNRLAMRYAERAGMEVYGVNPRSYLKGGKLLNQILMGLSRPEVTSCH